MCLQDGRKYGRKQWLHVIRRRTRMPSSAPLACACLGQGGASFICFTPKLARVAIVDYINQILIVHVRDTREPMHQSLDMRHAARLQIHVAEYAEKESFHLWRTTQGCDCFEASCCKGCIRTVKLHDGSSSMIFCQRISQDDSPKACDRNGFLLGQTLGNNKFLPNIETFLRRYFN